MDECTDSLFVQIVLSIPELLTSLILRCFLFDIANIIYRIMLMYSEMIY